jgi:CTP synthase
VSTKHIFITGGVISGLGKGLIASSLGMLLKSWGQKVSMQKFDPYLNIDPGTMNPLQHGEVFVTDDGGETDLDLGNYERFINESLPRLASATTGQVYTNVLNKERRGEFLGDTVQVIPHIVDEIKFRMRAQENNEITPDVIITEIGGTVGDIESQPFLEAARQIRQDVGRDNVFFVHVSLVPLIRVSGELKTKPTQHSVMALRSLGITPNALVLRSEIPVTAATKAKIALFCDVEEPAIVNSVDRPSIYDVPFMLREAKLDEYIIRFLGLEKQYQDIKDNDIYQKWLKLIENIHNPEGSVEIALVGKYIELHDSYLSVSEALKSAGFNHKLDVKIRWVDAETCESPAGAQQSLRGVDGVLVPGGFGARGVDGKIGALKWARENKVPTLGICLGLQSMVIEYARNVLGIQNASSTEFDPNTPEPVIATIDEQVDLLKDRKMGGTMRLGSYDAQLKEGSLAAELYQDISNNGQISERHRHRYEVNNAYIERLENAGLSISGTSLGKSKKNTGDVLLKLNQNSNDNQDLVDQSAVGLVEFVELDRSVHPYYIATQAHPEFKSRTVLPHPLFSGLIAAAKEFQEKKA